MLNILNPNTAVELLRRNEIPQTSQLLLIGVVVLFKHLFNQTGIIGSASTPNLLPFAVFGLLINLATLVIAFRSNGGSDGRDFINRFVVLTWVLTIWIAPISMALYYAAFYVVYGLVGSSVTNHFQPYGIAQFVLLAGVSLATMLSMQHFMAKAASRNAT